VHVELGPLPSESATLWLAYAREVLGARRAHDAETLPDEVRDGFERYLTEWEKAASEDASFRWSTEVDPELVEYLVHAFYRVAVRLSEEAERRGGKLAPPGGDVFYTALVRALLGAIAKENPAAAEFAEHLRAFWPGVVAEEMTS
jgi:hypothetical protein